MDPPFGDYRQEAVRGYALGCKKSQSQQHVSLLATVLGVCTEFRSPAINIQLLTPLVQMKHQKLSNLSLVA